MFKTIKYIIKHKKGNLELSELGKLILGIILLIVLIIIITVIIKPELWTTGARIKDAFNIFK